MADEANTDCNDYLAALSSGDERRISYIYRRLQIRRRMMIIVFVVLIFGGCALIIAGVSSDAIAARIAQLAVIIGTFMVTLGGWLTAYMGFGTYEHGSFFSTSGGFSNTVAGPPAASQPLNHPRLTKNPTQAS